MRRFIYAATMTAAMACAATLIGTRAEAMAIPRVGGLAAATSAEPVYATCTRFWNGWRWVRRCVEAVPSYGYGYYGPAYGYYGPGWGWRRRYGYY